MIHLFYIILFMLVSVQDFKIEQKKFNRVRTAYAEKEEGLMALLKKYEIEQDQLQVYVRGFKEEKELELWAKNKKDASFQLLKTYPICATCGTLGPKRKQGDMQIPEGFYHINTFNPASKFYLSMRLNYPNQSDKVLSDPQYPGSDIYIHGDCVTIGCLPITNNQIKELYIVCVEARNNGQQKIPVTLFPARLNEANYQRLRSQYKTDNDRLNLWRDLKKGFDLFNQSKQLFSVHFNADGTHQIK
nr:L,D-transpeptidase family protein [uncultured Carboxylicivirga sp.]